MTSICRAAFASSNGKPFTCHCPLLSTSISMGWYLSSPRCSRTLAPVLSDTSYSLEGPPRKTPTRIRAIWGKYTRTLTFMKVSVRVYHHNKKGRCGRSLWHCFLTSREQNLYERRSAGESAMAEAGVGVGTCARREFGGDTLSPVAALRFFPFC